MATHSTPSRANTSAAARTSSALSGVRTLPSASTRSSTPIRSGRATSGAGVLKRWSPDVLAVLVDAHQPADLEDVAEPLGGEERLHGRPCARAGR